MSFFKRSKEDQSDYFDALILLLSHARVLESHTLKRLMSPDEVRVLGEDGRFRVASDNYLVNVWSLPTTYPPGKPSDYLANTYREVRLQDQILGHHAFISVSLDANLPRAVRPGYELAVTKFAGALIDETVLVVIDAATSRTIVPTAASVALLREGRRKEALAIPGVEAILLVKDGVLDEAIGEAQRRFPEFLKAYQTPNKASHFQVKMAFTDPISVQTEHMWISVTEVSNSQISGRLDSSPRYVRSLRQGQTVSKPVSDLSDWAYLDAEGPHGLFTEGKL